MLKCKNNKFDLIPPPPRISKLFPDKEKFIMYMSNLKDMSPPFHVFIKFDGVSFLHNKTDNFNDFINTIYNMEQLLYIKNCYLVPEK